MSNLQGRNAFCVGATNGIGRAVAIRLAELGANVTIVGRNSAAEPELISELKKVNPAGNHSFVTIDASSMKSIRRGCQSYLDANKQMPLHYLVMSQGKHGVTSVGTVTPTSLLYLFRYCNIKRQDRDRRGN
jgi:3-oxoacyl-[acyl-carrier protein] reductase